MRFPFLFFAALLFLAGSAFADLEIRKARYGNTSAYHDVRGIVEAYVRNKTLSFPINARSMGGDPTGRGPDFFFVVYAVDGREFTDTVADGKIFTFQGIIGLRPVQPPLNLPFLKPAAPASAPLAIVNRSGLPVSAYQIDRFGQWVWAAEVISGRTLSMTSKVGEEWILTDARGHVLARQRMGRGENVLIAEPPDSGNGSYRPSAEEAWVRFENGGFRTLYLYNLDPAKRWNWMATIEPRSGYSASTHVGETWIATDTSNHVVRNVTAPPGETHVTLN